FKIAPSGMRTSKVKSDGGVKVKLSYRPPFDWDYALKFLVSHQIEGIEEIEDNSYKRAFNIEGTQGNLIVRNLPAENKLELEIETDDSAVLFQVVRRVRSMFDL